MHLRQRWSLTLKAWVFGLVARRGCLMSYLQALQVVFRLVGVALEI